MIRPILASVIDARWAPAVIPPPYDALTREEREQHLGEHAHSFLHVTRSADASHGHPTEHVRLATEGNSALSDLIKCGTAGVGNGPTSTTSMPIEINPAVIKGS